MINVFKRKLHFIHHSYIIDTNEDKIMTERERDRESEVHVSEDHYYNGCNPAPPIIIIINVHART